MKQDSVAKIIFVTTLFLFILLVGLGVDFALTAAVILIVILFSLSKKFLLLFAAVAFSLNLGFEKISFSPRYISDLVLCAYLLFATWAVFYAFPRIKMPAKKELGKIGFWDNTMKIVSVIILSLLGYPLIGGYGVFIFGYAGLIILLGKLSDSRVTFWPALVLLGLCPLTLLAKLPDLTEMLAILSFLLLTLGMIQEVLIAIKAHDIVQPVVSSKFETL